MHSVVFLYVAEIFPIVNAWLQEQGMDSIPNDVKQLTSRDLAVLQRYLCDKSRFVYEEKEEIHNYGAEAYELEVDFAFNCEVMMFVDDQVRIRFYNDWDNPIEGLALNTSKSYNASGDVPASDGYSPHVNIKRSTSF